MMYGDGKEHVDDEEEEEGEGSMRNSCMSRCRDDMAVTGASGCEAISLTISITVAMAA